MSISSLISPSGELSVQDSLWHIASSTNSGQTDFKYVFDIYNGTNQLIRVKLFPDPTNGQGYFDAGPIIRNEISYDWFEAVNNGSGVFLYEPSISGEVAVTYNVRVGEDYSGITTLNMASGNVTAYNYASPVFQRFVKQISDMDNTFLTNRPRTINAQASSRILIPYKTSGTKTVVGKITANGTTYTGSSFTINNSCQLDIGIGAIHTYLSGHPLTGVDSYTFRLYESATSQYSETITVNIGCRPLYTNINLYFINQWGMFDTASFNLASRLTLDTEKKSFTKKDFSYNTSSVDYYSDSGVYKESKVNYGSKTNWSYKLTMDYPSDAEYQWLAELMTSPQIYAELDGYYYPVTIKNTNYEYSTYQNNRLRAFEIDIEMNQTRYGFLR